VPIHYLNGRPLPERSKDWFNQAKRDLENARYELEGRFYEFSCFLSEQAAEKAMKSLYQKIGAEVFGHSVIGLINWTGGYQGVYYADSTNWIASLYGHPPAWIAYNPVPSGY